MVFLVQFPYCFCFSENMKEYWHTAKNTRWFCPLQHVINTPAYLIVEQYTNCMVMGFPGICVGLLQVICINGNKGLKLQKSDRKNCIKVCPKFQFWDHWFSIFSWIICFTLLNKEIFSIMLLIIFFGKSHRVICWKPLASSRSWSHCQMVFWKYNASKPCQISRYFIKRIQICFSFQDICWRTKYWFFGIYYCFGGIH